MSTIECYSCSTIYDRKKHYLKSWFIDTMNNTDERMQLFHKVIPYHICNTCRTKNKKNSQLNTNVFNISKSSHKSNLLRIGECEACGKIDEYGKGQNNSNKGLIHCYTCKPQGMIVCYDCHGKIHCNKN